MQKTYSAHFLLQHDNKVKMLYNFDTSLDDEKFSKKEQENFYRHFFALRCEKKKKFRLEKLEEKMKDLKKIGDTSN
jgi:hypothetical protein